MGGRSAATQRTYRSDRRDAQARLTRRRVLDAATDLFLARGYAATTVREVANRAGVAVATVELLFGRKARLLKTAIDVAVAGDDEPVAVLDRRWAATAAAATTAEAFLSTVAAALTAAQQRSAGLVLAVFEGATRDDELAALAAELVDQRDRMADWLVTRLRRVAPRRRGLSHRQAVDTVWLLMDSVVFDRLTRQRGWSADRYERWFADSVRRLILDDDHMFGGGP
jgi:AcrR family transcriptional regulator